MNLRYSDRRRPIAMENLLISLLLVLPASFDTGHCKTENENGGESSNELSSSSSSDYPWNYNKLNTHLQSPVDIITSFAVKKDYKPLKFSAVNDDSIECIIRNSGHGVTVQIAPNEEKGDSIKPRLSGSFLDGIYIFENIHFHWGKQDYFGSEHFINGESFSLEGHMVTFKKDYGTISNALKFKDGVMVLTFFGDVGRKNEDMERLLKHIPEIIKADSSVKAESLDPILWFLPDLIECNRYTKYYAYPGSLTTPTFDESVTFLIIPEPIAVSHEQLEVLRTLEDDHTQPVLTNRREIQPLRQRPLISANNIKWNVKTKCVPLDSLTNDNHMGESQDCMEYGS